MDFQLNNRRLPAPSNINISSTKNPGQLLIVWDPSRNPDDLQIRQGIKNPYLIKEVRYNVYRGISLGGIFYKLNPQPATTPRFEDKNVSANPNTQYFYKVSSVAVLFDGSIIEGELSPPVIFHIPTTNKWFKKINERNMWILKNTGVLMDLYVRKTEGEKCTTCWDDVREQGTVDCPDCYGTGFTGGFEPMTQIYVRQKPAQQKLDLGPQGYTLDSTPGAWTISPVQLRNRDLLINPQGIMFTVLSSHVNHAAGYLFHQELQMKELVQTDERYKIRRATLYPDY